MLAALGTVGLVITPAWMVPAEAVAGVSPPPSIAANCSVDVSVPMQQWLRSLPAGTTVTAPSGACYLLNEGVVLWAPQGLTITGGTWEELTRASASPNPVFWLVGGNHVTLENLALVGANPGGYHPAGAFAAGIRSDGVIGLTVSDVQVDDVYGDGIELNALRGQGDIGGDIVRPSEQVAISNVSINGAGRQGITMASVDGVMVTSAQFSAIGINVFDLEADQGNEGAANVVINGCTDAGGAGGLFFANGGAGAGGYWTHDITVENCSMSAPDGGDAVLVQSPASVNIPRGPFTFVDDTLRCGASVYVACVQLTGADVTVSMSSLLFPAGTVHEAVFHAVSDSTLVLNGDTIRGYGSLGSNDTTSLVKLIAGLLAPFLAHIASAVPSVPSGQVHLTSAVILRAPTSSRATASTPVPAPVTQLPSARTTGALTDLVAPSRVSHETTSNDGLLATLAGVVAGLGLVGTLVRRGRRRSASTAQHDVHDPFLLGL